MQSFWSVILSAGFIHVSHTLRQWAWNLNRVLEGVDEVVPCLDTPWWFLPNAWAVVLMGDLRPVYALEFIRTRYLSVAVYRVEDKHGHGKKVAMLLRTDRETIRAMDGRNDEGFPMYAPGPPEYLRGLN